MPQIKRVPRLSKKTAAQRGAIDPESLSAAINWDKLMSPDLFDLDKNVQEISKSDNLAEPPNGRLMIPQLPGASFFIEQGGPTSGNWGHSGRPGIRGGSAEGGGHAFFPVLDRAKMGGHSENDILGMVTMRRQEMETIHAGTELGRIKGDGAKVWAKRWKLQAAKEAAEMQAGFRKRHRLEAERQVRIETEQVSPVAVRQALGDLEAEWKPRLDAQAEVVEAGWDASKKATKAIIAASQRITVSTYDEETGKTRFRYETVPKEGVSDAEFARLKQVYEDASAHRSTQVTKKSEMAKEYLEVQRDLVTVDDSVALNAIYRVRGFKQEGREETWNAGRDGFQRIVSANLQPDGFTVNFRKGGKGRSSALDDDIKLSIYANAGVVVHELGHIIEHQNPMALSDKETHKT